MNDTKKNPFDKSYYYGAVYKNYDEFIDFERIAKDLYSKFNFNSFLDIGCGCGNLPIAVNSLLSTLNEGEFDVQGVDISEFAVAKANKPYINTSDCRDLSMFEAGRFDLVHILGTFSYLSGTDEIIKAMKEADRVSNRYIVFDDVYKMPPENHDDYDPHRVRAYSQKEWHDLWEEAINNFESIEFHADEIIIKKSSY